MECPHEWCKFYKRPLKYKCTNHEGKEYWECKGCGHIEVVRPEINVPFYDDKDGYEEE